MFSPTYVLSLDAMSPILLEKWMAEDKLPHIADLRTQGIYGRLHKAEHHTHESSWPQFLYGCPPDVTGHWGHGSYDAHTYTYTENHRFDQSSQPQFFLINPARSLALFDLSYVDLIENLNGVQIFGWGAEANQYVCESWPPELFEEIIQRFGEHPIYSGLGVRQICKSDGRVYSFRNPSIYDLEALHILHQRLLQGIRHRTDIIVWLIETQRPDFLLGVYGEPHIGSHLLWHLGSLPHPLQAYLATDTQMVLDLYQAIDKCIGRLTSTIPEAATLCLFSPYGMKENATDMLLTLFLPEFLYRWHFGRAALAEGDPSVPVPVPRLDFRHHWKDEIWALRTAFGERDLESPDQLTKHADPLDWNPTVWYRRLWPQMKAFCLPTYYQGMVCLNVQGREGNGVVAPHEFLAECDALSAALMQLTDSRTGRPIVKKVLRTRDTPGSIGAVDSPADLIVVWHDRQAVDTVDSPQCGRIGPAPYFRSGGHAPRGFCLLRGPGIPAGGDLPADARVFDLTAQLLTCMSETVPRHLAGHPWFSANSE